MQVSLYRFYFKDVMMPVPKKCLLTVLFFAAVLTISLPAATVDTLAIPATRMNLTAKAIIVLPASYGETPLPVVYLLHGWSGNYRNWFDKADLQSAADRYNLIIVCPDGGYAGWYLDSSIDTTSRYESYIVYDVVDFIDQRYKTIPDEKGRVLCGLSMGGHGALSLLAKHPDRFTAAGSMSGVLDLDQSSGSYGLLDLLGPYETHGKDWTNTSCLILVENLKDLGKGIILDCGIEDRFIPDNRRVHQRLMELAIPHDYYERPGGHSWDYWVNALDYHLIYFNKFLNRE